jgi:hypothetical protein
MRRIFSESLGLPSGYENHTQDYDRQCKWNWFYEISANKKPADLTDGFEKRIQPGQQPSAITATAYRHTGQSSQARENRETTRLRHNSHISKSCSDR